MPLWSDGPILLRADGGPLLEVPRPYALIGRTDGSDLRIADRTLSARHVYVHLDRRGLFAVDLATRTGSRFDGVAAPAAWLQSGSFIEIAGHRVELFHPRDHSPQDHSYHLTDATSSPLARISLHPLPALNTPWTLNSELVFLGRSLACGVPIVGGSAARVHAVIVRTPEAAYIVNLAGWGVWLDGQLVRGAASLEDGSLLIAGSSRFEIRIGPSVEAPSRPAAARREIIPEPPFDPGIDLHEPNPLAENDRSDSSVDVRGQAGIDLATLGGAYHGPGANPPVDLELDPEPGERPMAQPPAATAGGAPENLSALFPPGLAPPPGLFPSETQAALMGWLLGAVQTIQSEMLRRQDEFQHELVRALHTLHRDNQDALELHQERVDAIHKELTELREDIRKRFNSEIPTPRVPSLPRPAPRIAPPSADAPPADPAAATAWLLNRVNRLDEANRSSWRDLLGRLGSKPS